MTIMSQIANIAIADGATTPVTHTFTPIQSSPNAVWKDSDAAKAYVASQYIITATRKSTDSTKGLTRTRISLVLPTMGNGVALPSSEVDYSHQVVVEFISPNRGLKQERKDTRTLLKNLLADAQIIDMVDELHAAY